jgi:hypothetical protein
LDFLRQVILFEANPARKRRKSAVQSYNFTQNDRASCQSKGPKAYFFSPKLIFLPKAYFFVVLWKRAKKNCTKDTGPKCIFEKLMNTEYAQYKNW